MATFLELVNDVARESGTVDLNQRLITVASAHGRHAKIVEWVRTAWVMIQNSRNDWAWMRRDFSALLTIGQARYTPDDLGIEHFGEWVKAKPYERLMTTYDPVLGRESEQDMDPWPYSDWRNRWDFGSVDNNRPTEWAVDYSGKLCVGAPPDKAYVLRGDYYRSAQVLEADGDIPICPPEHHRIILFQALILLGEHDESPSTVQTARFNYANAHRNLVNSSVEAVRI